MRDYLVLAVILAALPVCLYRPYIGVLCWVWIGLMNPHRFAWGAAQNFPVAMVVAAATLAGVPLAMLRREVRWLPWTRESLLLILLWLVFTFTTVFAVDGKTAWEKWALTSKILLMSVVALLVLQDKAKVKYLLAVSALSIGFLGLKGGLFGLTTSGQHVVFGPQASFVADNNALALAELMTLPLLFYFGKMEASRYRKLAWYAMAVFTMLSVLLSYSRGALLGFVAMIFLLVLRSSRKLLTVPLVLAGVLFAMTVVPEQWLERMSSIETYQQDRSAMSRINGWIFAYRLALDYPFTGGGFGAFNKDLFEKYAPEPDDVYNGHSIYFQVLGEHGFLGFGVFGALLLASLATVRRIRKVTETRPGFEWARDYATMLQVSLLAYAVSGAFLPLAYFDLYYYLVVAVIILKVLVRRELESGHPDVAPDGEATKVAGEVSAAAVAM